ncbi:tetratricopeptide repeat protein [Luteolibacter yonseiensis]|uniref:Tetratricopeptide repeat protein n=1 Tax=Luteolibacter yonseiensis TaxID=1144680 RepID=A0A934R2H7_9BACT|nr:tetratricopeptide repeat protein [Luteolibacter yonseiensis]MBK1814120.1 tetratricopeptide repeat protein [Luteolibacter yonseiensis]
MKFWPLFPLLLLSPVRGQGADAFADHERKGEAALADGLWEMAELHFRNCLAAPGLTPGVKSRIGIRLAESLVREGNPSAALELLEQSFVEKNAEALFWKAQALAGQKRFAEAADLFSHLLENPAAAHRTEAGLTLASLRLALDQPEAALGSLAGLIPGADEKTAARIRLYQVEILLDLGRAAPARAAMPETADITAEDQPLASFLNAQLLLKEDHPAEAEAAFRELLNHADGQTLAHYHAAAIGLADAVAAGGKAEDAAKSLLAFIQDHPGSPLLDTMFGRILQWLPEKPATTDPVLERLALWITPPLLPPISSIATPASGSAVAAWPTYETPSSLTDRLVFSIYARAIGLHRIGTTETKAEAHLLFNRLRIEHPGHFLATRSLYQSARWLLDEGDSEQAFSLLNTLRQTADSTELKGEAAFLEARAAYRKGDPKLAIQLFEEAARSLGAPEARTARLQAAIARLHSGEGGKVHLIQNQNTAPDQELDADLELERALSTTPPAAAAPLLEEFLKRFPDHPRAAEARLAVAEAALSGTAPDVALAKIHLDALEASSEKSAALPPPRLALMRMRMADLTHDSAAAMAQAQAIMDTYPGDPVAAEAAFTLGRNQFQAGSYNDARLVFQKLATTDTDPDRAQAAWLLTARSAALGGTPQSKEEALVCFDKACESKGPLKAIATLEKASFLIDMYRLPEASAFLGKWIKTLPEDDPLQLPAGLLLGEALYAQGSSNESSMVEALAVYDRLLAHARSQPSLLNRLQYLRGTTLEQLPDPKNPGKNREKEAFQAYYSVLETTTPPTEWEYFERCGFGALALLEKAERWQTAISVAQKIASFKGPQAEIAAARARKIKLEQMIFEDD